MGVQNSRLRVQWSGTGAAVPLDSSGDDVTDHGGAGLDELKHGAIRRRVLLPNYFVGTVIIEQVVDEGDLLLVTVRTEAGGLEQVTLTPPELRAALGSALDEPKVVNPNEFFLLID